jgi:hypothetical protein
VVRALASMDSVDRLADRVQLTTDRYSNLNAAEEAFGVVIDLRWAGGQENLAQSAAIALPCALAGPDAD